MFGRQKNNADAGNECVSLSLDKCLAKTHKTVDGHIENGRLVLSHCTIVGMVAQEITARMPHWLAHFFPKNSHLIAAAHDIGKVSPTFQKKIYSAITEKDQYVLDALRKYSADIEKQWGGHAGVSQATASMLNVGAYIPEILGQHHGFSPDLGVLRADSEPFGGHTWYQQRVDLLDSLASNLGVSAPIKWPEVKDAVHALLLSGLTTVSDWIGSGPDFEDPSIRVTEDTIRNAVDSAGFVHPTIQHGLSFKDIFGFNPNDTQVRFTDTVQGPGVYVLEAPMGLGKTEAALHAAYKTLDSGQATGIYFALPTQLTSDKIHERVNAFLSSILANDSTHRQSFLLHGQAWLKSSGIMGEEGNPGGAWFAQGKRSILAPFAVGTVDQALMAVMRVKHGFVRTFGLAGKVVVLDEVHSYDSYTGTLLDVLIETLLHLKCTVIILSATLTRSRRDQLMGLRSDRTTCEHSDSADAYPLISAWNGVTELYAKPVSPLSVEVRVQHSGYAAAIDEALLRAESGQQVLWIENTVREAQDVYKELAAVASGMGNVECGLLHSRFTVQDRAHNDAIWVSLYGKDGALQRSACGRILVGTQVLEQSLDIDADFLVTRLAPTDMLLQRTGRLWRHQATQRPDGSAREMWIVSDGMQYDDAGEPDLNKTFGVSAMVYNPYVLYRSMEVWHGLNSIVVPDQVRDVIESTYSERQEKQDSISKHLSDLKKGRDSLQRMAKVGLSRGGKTLPEEKAQTRHSELSTVQVLLLKSVTYDGRKAVRVRLMDDKIITIPRNGRSAGREKWQNLTMQLTRNTLNVATYMAPSASSRNDLDWLSDYFYLGNPDYNEDCPLRLGLVGDDGVIRLMSGRSANGDYSLSYNNFLGYVADKCKG